MGLRERRLRRLAAQLGRPSGLQGGLVARRLNRRNVAGAEAAAEASGVRPRDRAADLGFGGGVGLQALLARVLPGGHVVGVDLSEDMVRRARRRFAEHVRSGTLALHPGSITALPLSPGSLDAVITLNTIFFVPALDQAFAELFRVLRPGGRAVVGIGDPEVMATFPVTAYGFILRPLEEVRAALVDAGFEGLSSSQIGEGYEVFHLLVAHRP